MSLVEIKTSTSPTLSSGVLAVTFNKFEKVTDALVTFDDPKTANRVLSQSCTISGNVVTITFSKMQLSATRTWGTAANSDIPVVRVIAQGT